MNKFTFVALLLIGFFIVAVSYNAGNKPDPTVDDNNPFSTQTKDTGDTLGLNTSNSQTNKGQQQEMQVGSPSKNVQVPSDSRKVKFTASPLTDHPDPAIKAKLNISIPDIELKDNIDYKAVITTDKGDITIDLFENLTPETVKNFVYLANNNFYNDVVFHRIIKDFMIQTGDPKGDGKGGPGYKFEDEKFDGQYTKGTVAMANSGPDTNGSQFFIMHGNKPLPLKYVIFGQVTEGIETVDDIANVQVTENDSIPPETSKPVEPVKMISVKIIETAKVSEEGKLDTAE